MIRIINREEIETIVKDKVMLNHLSSFPSIVDEMEDDSIWVADHDQLCSFTLTGYDEDYYVGDQTYIIRSSDTLDNLQICRIVPVIESKTASFHPGEMFILGKGRNKLPLRWFAIMPNLLILYDHPRYLDMLKVFYSREMIEYAIDRCLKSSFTEDEQEKILSGDLENLLVHYKEIIEVFPETSNIPFARYRGDKRVKELKVLDRGTPLWISDSAFAESNLSRVEGLDFHSTIGAHAFFDACLEETLVLGDIKSIGHEAFKANGINSIKVNGLVDSIDFEAFSFNGIKKVEFDDDGYFLRVGGHAFQHNEISDREKILDRILVQYADNLFE